MKKVCIVGYGNVGPVHAKALESIKNVQLYAVCDSKEERRKACNQIYHTIEYADYEQMLKDTEIDCVHICTPHYLHFPMIEKALVAGKKVITEKPVTMTRQEYERLREIDLRREVAVVMQNRINPCVKKLKELVESKALGKVKAAKAILTWQREKAYYEEEPWRGRWETAGGGLLMNQAIHTLDLLIYLLGGIKKLKSHMRNDSLQNIIEVEDTLSAHLEFENGVKGIFYATNAYEETSDVFLEIMFEKGTVRYIDKQLWLSGKCIERDEVQTPGKAYWGSGHCELLRRYYEENEYFSIDDVKNTMETVYAIYEGNRKND